MEVGGGDSWPQCWRMRQESKAALFGLLPHVFWPPLSPSRHRLNENVRFGKDPVMCSSFINILHYFKFTTVYITGQKESSGLFKVQVHLHSSFFCGGGINVGKITHLELSCSLSYHTSHPPPFTPLKPTQHIIWI